VRRVGGCTEELSNANKGWETKGKRHHAAVSSSAAAASPVGFEPLPVPSCAASGAWCAPMPMPLAARCAVGKSGRCR
jgi:hypothetical protein